MLSPVQGRIECQAIRRAINSSDPYTLLDKACKLLLCVNDLLDPELYHDVSTLKRQILKQITIQAQVRGKH